MSSELLAKQGFLFKSWCSLARTSVWLSCLWSIFLTACTPDLKGALALSPSESPTISTATQGSSPLPSGQAPLLAAVASASPSESQLSRICAKQLSVTGTVALCEPQAHPQEVFFLSGQAQLLSEQGYEMLKQNRCSEGRVFFKLAYEQENSLIGRGYLSSQISQASACEQKKLSYAPVSVSTETMAESFQAYAVEYVVSAAQTREQIQKGHDALVQGKCAEALVAYTSALFEVEKKQLQHFLDRQRQQARSCLLSAKIAQPEPLSALPSASVAEFGSPASTSPEPTSDTAALASHTPSPSPSPVPSPSPSLSPSPVPSPTISPSGTSSAVYQTCSEGPGKLRWKQNVSGEIRYRPVLGQDGKIYFFHFVNQQYELLAFDALGRISWRYPVQQDVRSSPAVAPDGSVIFATREGRIYAIRPDGSLKWMYNTGQSSTPQSPTIAQDGTVYLVSGERLFILNANGTLKSSSSGMAGRPLIGPDGTIYYNQLKSKLTAIGTDGKLKWQTALTDSQTQTYNVSGMAIDEHGNLYITARNYNVSRLHAIRSEDGQLLWEIPLTNPDYQILLDQQQIYLTHSTSNAPAIRALNRQTQIEKWLWNQKSSSPVLQGAGGILYAFFYGSSLGIKMLAFASDGSVLWDYRDYENLASGAETGLVLAPDGSLYTAHKNTIYAVCTSSQGLASGPWPTLGKDGQNSGRY